MAGSLHPSAADNEAERKRQEDARAAQAAARRATRGSGLLGQS